MDEYTLEIDLSELPVLQELVLVKEYDAAHSTNLPWTVFRSYPQNTLKWKRTFSLYAANVNDKHAVTILACQPIDEGKCRLFRNNRFEAAEDGTAGKFSIKNQTKQPLFFGLMQALSINGGAYKEKPINIVSVPPCQTAEFTPIEDISLFLGTGYEEQLVMGIQVHSEILRLDFTNAHSASIVYDKTTGTLIKG